MNEERFNTDIRKFLRVVGVTSQREIEAKVRAALAAGLLSENVLLKPRATVSIPEIGLEHVVEGEIGMS
jgi:plasmid stability protein